MRKSVGILTNDTDNMTVNRPLLLEPVNPPKNHRCLIVGIVILTHSLTFLLGFYVSEVLRKDDYLDGSS
jgi:hypothetical protein